MPESESRSLERRRTFLRGRVFYGPTFSLWADCAIQNLAEGGAKLKLPATQPLPEDFVLLVVGEGVALECELRWRRDDAAGVKILARHDLHEPTAGRMAPIRAVWRMM